MVEEVAVVEDGAGLLLGCVGGEADVEAAVVLAALVEAAPSPLGSGPEALLAVAVALIFPVK